MVCGTCVLAGTFGCCFAGELLSGSGGGFVTTILEDVGATIPAGWSDCGTRVGVGTIVTALCGGRYAGTERGGGGGDVGACGCTTCEVKAAVEATTGADGGGGGTTVVRVRANDRASRGVTGADLGGEGAVRMIREDNTAGGRCSVVCNVDDNVDDEGGGER